MAHISAVTDLYLTPTDSNNTCRGANPLHITIKTTRTMKKTLFIIMLMLAGFHTCNAQQVKREGNTFTQSTKVVKNEQTKYTWKDSKGNEYPIYIAKSGSCYVVRVSKKSGKEYKQYLGKEISAEICKELGREYKPTNSK